MVMLKPYWETDHVFLVYELDWNGQNIRPGDPVRIKRRGCNFRFARLVSQDGEEHIECLDMQSGKIRRFKLKQLAGPAIKRSRNK